MEMKIVNKIPCTIPIEGTNAGFLKIYFTGIAKKKSRIEEIPSKIATILKNLSMFFYFEVVLSLTNLFRIAHCFKASRASTAG